MAHLKGSWSDCILEDFRWLAMDGKCELMDGYCFQQWIQYARSNRKSLGKQIKAFAKCRFANIPEADGKDIDGIRQSLDKGHFCALCNEYFMSMQSISVHDFRAHGIKSIWRQYVDTTHCTMCMREFWTRERCLNHIRYRSKVCRAQMWLRGPCLSEAEASVLDESVAEDNRSLHSCGQRRHFASMPVIQLSGPLPIHPAGSCHGEQTSPVRCWPSSLVCIDSYSNLCPVLARSAPVGL